MFLAASAMAGPHQEPTDQVGVEPREDMLELSWSDAEESLKGSISPAVPRAGEPLQVIVQLGSFEGAPFEGPITFTLREAGATHGQTVTVPHGQRHWKATFTPEKEGPHLLDVSFRTTRYKALHAAIEVKERGRVPRAVGWGVLGLGALALLGYGVHNLMKGMRPEEQASASSVEESAPVAAPPPASAPENPVAATSPGSEAQAPSSTESPGVVTATPPMAESPAPPAAAPTPAEQAASGADPSPSPAPPENTPPASQ